MEPVTEGHTTVGAISTEKAMVIGILGLPTIMTEKIMKAKVMMAKAITAKVMKGEIAIDEDSRPEGLYAMQHRLKDRSHAHQALLRALDRAEVLLQG
jgi:hypothetical protein